MMGKGGRSLLLCALLAMAPASGGASDSLTASKAKAYESLLVAGLEALQANRLDEAMEKIGKLIREEPGFRLAQLIYGDLLLAHATDIKRFGGETTGRTELREDLSDLLDEARARLQHALAPPNTDWVPEPLMQLPRENAFAILVDISKSRLYLFRNDPDRPRLVVDFYISTGKNGMQKFRQGDKRTPLGVYFIRERFPKDKLPDFYGAGALPINYPNEWDRMHRRTGYGIWLHGTPVDTYSRPPRASDGCVALTNPDFLLLEELVGIGTPVVIADQVTWLAPDHWERSRREFLEHLDTWTRLWQGRDVDGVLSRYAPDFHNNTRNFETWKREIRWVLTVRPDRGGDLSEYTVLGYPGTSPMVLVSYGATGQEAASGVVRRQLWRREGDKKEWRIVFEELS